MKQSLPPEALGPIFRLATIVLPWVAGPLLIRVPQSGYLLQTVAEQQFWFYTLSASCFGFVTAILQGVYDKQRRTGILNIITYVITVIALIAGFSLAFEAVRTRLEITVFLIVATFLLSLAVSQLSQRRNFAAGMLVGIGATGFLAAVLSMTIFSGAIAWPAWIAAFSFAAPLLSSYSHKLGRRKLAHACLVMMPLPVAWLVSVTLLPLAYLLIGGLYALIIPMLHSPRYNEPVVNHWAGDRWTRDAGKVSVLFAVILIIARLM